MRTKYGIAKEDGNLRVITEERDYASLAKIKNGSAYTTQLEDDWRKPLLDTSNDLLERYK